PTSSASSFSIASTSSSSCGAKIRPLPDIPGSAADSSCMHSPRRPLPNPPGSNPRSRPLKSNTLPLIPSEAPLPSSSRPPAPPPKTAQCSRPACLPPLAIPSFSSCSLSTSSSVQTLLTPTSPCQPSPFTMKRRRFSKLRRHFGDAPPVDLVFHPEVNRSKSNAVSPDQWGDNFISFDSAFSEDDGDLTESENGSERGECVVDGKLGDGHTAGLDPAARCSIKWEQERGGRRWTEYDYHNVLEGLRNL
ncbi:hypothetical protein BJ138DRAFT_994301, partial [Hygrophoropsis aurantiaca]